MSDDILKKMEEELSKLEADEPPKKKKRKAVTAAAPAETIDPAPAPTTALVKVGKKEKHEIDDRRQSVLKLRMRGLTYDEIASDLGISAVTVRRDIEALKKDSSDAIDNFDRKQFIIEQIATYDDIIARAWKEYSTAYDTKDRLKCLDTVRAAKNDRFRMLQECGFVHNEPQKVEHKITLDVLQNWDDNFRQAVAKSVLENMLTPQLPEPVPEAEIIDVSEE